VGGEDGRRGVRNRGFAIGRELESGEISEVKGKRWECSRVGGRVHTADVFEMKALMS
jgi:hypothetical protein